MITKARRFAPTSKKNYTSKTHRNTSSLSSQPPIFARVAVGVLPNLKMSASHKNSLTNPKLPASHPREAGSNATPPPYSNILETVIVILC